MKVSVAGRLRLAAGFMQAAFCYWLSVYPWVCHEVAQLRRRAREIPDDELRGLALETIASKRGNLDGAAAFAAFVPFAHRRTVVRSLLAFQAAYDFADTLSEQPSDEPSANARTLHESLLVALKPTGAHPDYFSHSRCPQDGGYLAGIVDACRKSVGALPCYGLVADSVCRAARRIVVYQSLNVACPQGCYGDYARWAGSETPAGTGLCWWETGASAGSSLAIFALIAAAAGQGLDDGGVAAIEAAYWPWIGALHTLLDSLVDHVKDVAAGQQSLISNYGSSTATAVGLQRLSARSVSLAHELGEDSQHLILLAAMTGLYLSAPEARAPHALASTSSVLETMGELAKPTMIVMSLRRVLGGLAELR
jgi:tetraprenyl-beta-curcumene synthase